MKILYVDDETIIQEYAKKNLEKRGHSATICPDGFTGLAALQKESFDCMIVDLNMPGMTGLELIEHAKELRPEIDTVVITGNADQASAIAALRHHVFDYLEKPCDFKEVEKTLARVAEFQDQKRQLTALRHRLHRAEGESELVGSGPQMDRVRSLIGKVGPTDSTVLIRGETGCGKELVARALQQSSLRADKPMVAINCGALPEHLIESELFGHCRGAFTGADSARTGLFEVADGGTVFLDEVGELPLAMQAKLLRVLETGDIRRLGDNQIMQVNVRIICATHRNLEQMSEEGTFREDLMFRINTFEIQVPPLRDRAEDLPVLAEHLLRRHRTDGDNGNLFTQPTLNQLMSHKWPGNVRELANVIEHAAILCESLPIEPEDLPRHFGKRRLRKEIRDSGPMTLKEIEMLAIRSSLDRLDGDKTAAAKELGVSVKTLYNKLNAADEQLKAG